MHLRLSSLYECGCDNCRTKINLAADPKGKDFKSVLKAAENAFKHLHEKGSYKAEDINDKPYQKLISETNNVLSEGLRDNVIPPAMMAKMENDTFIFSGLKTHAQLLEASSFLRDEKGQVRNFDAFAYEFNKVNEKYNQNYLEAEHSFALRSSQMAANWAATDPDGRYNLQYRTANDDRVRENHRVLQDITLPKEDSFWLSYYPPNGWRCRCTAVEVRKSKFPESDSEKAIQAGEKATSQIGKDGKNKLEIFRFNPGAEQKVFPPKHPYNKVKDADVVKDILIKYDILDKNKRFSYEKEKVKDWEIDKVYKELNIHETTSVFMYTMADAYFGHLNNFNRFDKIRLGARADGFTKETLETMTVTINQALDKIPEKHVGLTYRGTDLTLEQFKDYETAWKNKTSMVEKGFMSSTSDKNKAFEGDTQFVIQSKTGAKVSKISAIEGEDEVLFKAGQKFKVTDIIESRDSRVIHLEED